MAKTVANKTFSWTLIWIAVAILAIVGLAFAAQPNSLANQGSTQSTANLLIIDPVSHDFGTISMADGVVRQSFSLTNPTAEPMVISLVYTSCMCTEATLTLNQQTFGPFGMLGHGISPQLKQTLGPNATATIEVAFDPAAHGPAGVGLIERETVIESGGQRLGTISTRANVAP